MRTIEEQIEDVFPDFHAEDAEATITKGDVRLMLEYAERRAEQRVRAEIARDSERLDWLCRNIKGIEARRIVGVISDTGCVDLWRAAIDAAREVG